MTECYRTSVQFPSVKRRKVEADFSGGDITGNGGITLLSTVDRRLGLTRAVAGSLEDPRRQPSCEHSLGELLGQRIYALALGHADLNDHGELRHDLALQTATNTVETLASASTLCRLGSWYKLSEPWSFHRRAHLGGSWSSSMARMSKNGRRAPANPSK